VRGLFDALVSLDASLASCSEPGKALHCCLDHLPSLLPCATRAVATIDDETLLPAITCVAPESAQHRLAELLADAVERGLFALALRRGQSVAHELPDGTLLILQAIATPSHLAGLLLGICPADQADPDSLAALSLAAARTGSAHESLVLRSRILAHADELEQAVAERTRDLAAARDRAESSSRAKSAFLATVSHELRTPLNGIIGMAELLHADERDLTRRDRLAVVRSCAEDLLRQIDSILDLSRIEAGRHELNPTVADPAGLVMAVLRTVAPQAQSKGVELAWIPAPGFPSRVMVDAGRLRQVLMNLVGNALKFSDSGSVVVRGTATGSQADSWKLSFAVVDDGPGITLEAQARLFTPFEQGDATINRRFGGSGLGLTISRRLCELMNGSLSMHSVPGQGSTFTATLQADAAPPVPLPTHALQAHVHAPVIMAEAIHAALACLGASVCPGPQATCAVIDSDAPDAIQQLERLPHTTPVVVLIPLAGPRAGISAAASQRPHRLMCKPIDAAELSGTLRDLLHGDNQHQTQTTSRHRLVTRFDGVRVLYADDQQVNRLVLAGQLKRLGIDVELATGGAEAVDLATADDWDVILLDCQMPEVDGFLAAARIRERGCKSPLVAVTAHAMAGDREECLLRGFDDYLAKPVRPSELVETISRWLSRPEEAEPDAPGLPASPPAPFAQLFAEVGTDIARDVLTAMLSEGPRLAREASGAAESGNLLVAGKRAHALKGDAGNLGLEDLAGIARDLEAAAKAGDAAAALAVSRLLMPAWSLAERLLRTALGQPAD
jgi:two-component system, sensor histidine kinase and response regulator